MTDTTSMPEDITMAAHDAALAFVMLTDREESLSTLHVAEQEKLFHIIASALKAEREKSSTIAANEAERRIDNEEGYDAASFVLQEPAKPITGLRYRPNEFDDWGQIRNADGSMFASVRRPASEEELAEHRRAGTDPYEDLARRLMSTFDAPAPTPSKHVRGGNDGE